MIVDSGVRLLQIKTQMHVVKMEKLGMRRRGTSLTAMLKQHYELPKNASYDTVLEKLTKECSNLEQH